MEKRVFRSWEDTSVKFFLITSAVLMPILLAFSILVVVLEYYYVPLLLVLAILSFFILPILFTVFILFLRAKVTFYDLGIERKYFKPQIVPYNKIVKVTALCETLVIVEKNGREEEIAVGFFTTKILVKILTYIQKKTAEYNCELEDFDPLMLAKITKMSYKKALKFKENL